MRVREAKRWPRTLVLEGIGAIMFRTLGDQASAGGATRTRVRDRSWAAGRHAHAIAAKLRSRAAQAAGQKQGTVARATGELAGLAGRAARGTFPVARTARPTARPRQA